MKINKSKKLSIKKRVVIIAAAVVLAAVIVFVLVFYYNNGHSIKTKNDQPAINYNPSTSAQQKAGSQTKSGSDDSSSSPQSVPGSTKKIAEVTITAANQNGSTLQIRSLIGAVENTGVCTLSLTSPGKTSVTKTAGSQALASTSTCQGFDVPVSELTTGAWHIVINYNSTELTGSATQDIVIK